MSHPAQSKQKLQTLSTWKGEKCETTWRGRGEVKGEKSLQDQKTSQTVPSLAVSVQVSSKDRLQKQHAIFTKSFFMLSLY